MGLIFCFFVCFFPPFFSFALLGAALCLSSEAALPHRHPVSLWTQTCLDLCVTNTSSWHNRRTSEGKGRVL